MLTLYRRHSAACVRSLDEQNLSAREKRCYLSCACPIWVYGNTETEAFPRQSLDTTDMKVAEAKRLALLKHGEDRAVHGPRIDDCIERFILARQDELGEKTTEAYRLHLKRLK